MRLIDADELIKFIENRYEITWEDDYEGGIKDACADILEKISTMPTIEPERKTGKWIKDEFGSRCSNCGLYAYRDKFDRPWESDFCPICGAYTKGENNV